MVQAGTAEMTVLFCMWIEIILRWTDTPTIRTCMTDPRSTYRKEKCDAEAYHFSLDALDITVSICNSVATVTAVELQTPAGTHSKRRKVETAI